MKIGMTGATGFIGTHLLKAFLSKNYDVYALQNKTKTDLLPAENIVNGSLTDIESLENFVKKVDVIIHAGGIVKAKNKEGFFAINTEGTRLLAEISAKHKIKKFLHVSSLAAREPSLSNYARSKYLADVILSRTQGLRYDIIRPPAVYGPGDNALLNILRPLKYNLGFKPKGEHRFSLIHVTDLVGAIVAWVEAEKTTSQIYTVSDKNAAKGYDWGTVIKLCSQAMGQDKHPFIVPVPKTIMLAISLIAKHYDPFLSAGKVHELYHPDWTCDHTALCKETGWRPSISAQSGLSETIHAYKAHAIL